MRESALCDAQIGFWGTLSGTWISGIRTRWKTPEGQVSFACGAGAICSCNGPAFGVATKWPKDNQGSNEPLKRH